MYGAPCHSCSIYGTWRSKEIEGGFKIIIWGEVKPQGKFLVGGVVDPSRHCQTCIMIIF